MALKTGFRDDLLAHVQEFRDRVGRVEEALEKERRTRLCLREKNDRNIEFS